MAIQYTVIEKDGTLWLYRNWFQDYEQDTITIDLEAGGFVVESLWGELTGQPYTSDSEWIGMVTRK